MKVGLALLVVVFGTAMVIWLAEGARLAVAIFFAAMYGYLGLLYWLASRGHFSEEMQ